MHKALFFLLLFPLLLFCEEVEIFSSSLHTKENVVEADHDVVVVYKDYILTADRAVFNRKSQELELFGNIKVLKNNEIFSMGEYAYYNLKEDRRQVIPVYLTEFYANSWINAKKADSCKSVFDIEEGTLSGCNPVNPLWTIRFDEAKYDYDSKWMDLYGASLNIYDVPVFYFPYLGYPMDNRRRSGLLIPSFGLSDTEGFFYQQPVYFAPYDSWDVELDPQIRTNRGYGIYGKFRFVDSADSSGSVSAGFFEENENYYQQYDLAHQTHWGYKVDYENRNWLHSFFGVNSTAQSGLFTDFAWVNDVDYINLQTNNELNNVTSQQVLSHTNLFYNRQYDYVGLYGDYYVDLDKVSNDTTLQNIPQAQYHHYMETFFDEHFFYDVDVNYNNYTRQKGITASQVEGEIPLSVQGSFLDDYLDVMYTALLYARQTSFGGSSLDPVKDINSSYGTYARNSNIVTAKTNLMAKYDSFSHAMTFIGTYTGAGSEYRKGYYDHHDYYCDPNYYLDGDDICQYSAVSEVQNMMQLGFSQYFFDDEGKRIFYQRLTQEILYEIGDRYNALENEMELTMFDSFSIYSDIYYNHKHAEVTKTISSLRYNNELLNVSLNHIYQVGRHVNNTSLVDGVASYLTLQADYKYKKHYRFNMEYDVDFLSGRQKGFEAGLKYSKRCLDVGISFAESNVPILTKDKASSQFQRYVFVNFVFKPIGGSDLSYKLSNN